MTEAFCKGCGAPIIWVVTPAGKTMPLDAEPVKGAWFIDSTGSQKGSPTAHPKVVRLSHFATCPRANDFPVCPEDGAIMVRDGEHLRCTNCGRVDQERR